MRDGIGHSLLVRHGRIDVEGHRRIGPTKLLTGDTDRLQHHAAGLDAPQVRGAAEHDVALEHRPAADIGVA